MPGRVGATRAGGPAVWKERMLAAFEARLAAAALVTLRALLSRTDLNVWPGGSRTVECLRCEGKFTSTSKDNRICDECRIINQRVTEGAVHEQLSHTGNFGSYAIPTECTDGE